MPEAVTVKPIGAANQWLLQQRSTVRNAVLTQAVEPPGVKDPTLVVAKIITPDDKEEADTVWVYDMMTELGVSQHNMCSCSVTAFGDILFVNTSNGVDESHINIPAPDAPSFMAMDKNTGEVALDRQVARTEHPARPMVVADGWRHRAVPQVIFAGGDGWVYSFDPKADAARRQARVAVEVRRQPKDVRSGFSAVAALATTSSPRRSSTTASSTSPSDRTRNMAKASAICGVSIPPNEATSALSWPLTPTTPSQMIPPHTTNPSGRARRRRCHGPIPTRPSSGTTASSTRTAMARFDFEETMHRSCGTVAIKDDLLYIADFSGLFHCLDAKTGKVHWTYDMLAAAWGSPLIVEDKVYIGDEDGDVCVFDLTAEPHEPIAEINMGNSVYSTPIVANDVLYIANRTHLFAIQAE